MKEIEKNLRLPVWAGSWLQVAQKLEHQDFYSMPGNQDDPVLIVPTKNIQVQSKMIDLTGEVPVMEFFHGDSVTVKMRAFDELYEILPKEDQIHKMYHDVLFYLTKNKVGGNPEEHPIMIFLEKLINLYHEE